MLEFFNVKQLIGLVTKRHKDHIQARIDTCMYRFWLICSAVLYVLKGLSQQSSVEL